LAPRLSPGVPGHEPRLRPARHFCSLPSSSMLGEPLGTLEDLLFGRAGDELGQLVGDAELHGGLRDESLSAKSLKLLFGLLGTRLELLELALLRLLLLAQLRRQLFELLLQRRVIAAKVLDEPSRALGIEVSVPPWGLAHRGLGGGVTRRVPFRRMHLGGRFLRGVLIHVVALLERLAWVPAPRGKGFQRLAL